MMAPLKTFLRPKRPVPGPARAAVLGVALLSAAWASAASAQACFIDKAVERDGALYLFVGDVSQGTFISGPPGFRQFEFRARKGVITVTSGLGAGEVQDRLTLNVDDTVALQADPQNACALTVSQSPQGLGFDWSSTTTPPAGPAVTQTGHVQAARPGR